MRRVIPVAFALVLTAPLGAQTPEFAPEFPLVLESVEIYGAADDLGVLIDSELGPDGSVYLADMANSAIVVYSPLGELAWTAGGKGQGPGEFRTIYRMTVDLSGQIYVLDRSGNAVSRFTSTGEFIDRKQISFNFSHVDDMVVTTAGDVVVSGVTELGEGIRDSAVHVFDAELNHVRSFGPLPEAEDRRVLSYWGAGGLSITVDGQVVYTRRLPYEVYIYSIEGQLQAKIETPFSWDVSPDDVIKITERAGGIRIERDGDIIVPAIAPARPLGPHWLIGGHRAGVERFWDIFSVEGDYLGSTPVPVDWGLPVGYDAASGTLWAKGQHLMEPVIRKLGVRVRGDRNRQ